MVSFLLSFFPQDVLDEILDLIKSVSEGFPTYSTSCSYLETGVNATDGYFAYAHIGARAPTNTGAHKYIVLARLRIAKSRADKC